MRSFQPWFLQIFFLSPFLSPFLLELPYTYIGVLKGVLHFWASINFSSLNFLLALLFCLMLLILWEMRALLIGLCHDTHCSTKCLGLEFYVRSVPSGRAEELFELPLTLNRTSMQLLWSCFPPPPTSLHIYILLKLVCTVTRFFFVWWQLWRSIFLASFTYIVQY